MQPSDRAVAALKALVFVLALYPLSELAIGALFFPEWLGANPAEYITRKAGNWTLRFVLLTLAVTPLRRMTGWNWLLKFRRMLGLYAFFYGMVHFSSFISFDHVFVVAEILKDIVKRPFITVGFTALVLMVPLAATSTNAMVRRLGAKRWLLLHRLVYVIAPLGVLHFWWMVKRDITQPAIFAAILAVLLGYRVAAKIRDARRSATVLVARQPMSIGLVLLAGAAAVVLAPVDARAQRAPAAEAQLRRALDALAEGRMSAALGEADRLVAQHPNFRLAHLLRGDLLLARVRPINAVGSTGHAARERLEELRAEAAVRLRAAKELPPPDRLPRYLLQLAPSQKHAIVVDASRSRVYVYENAGGVPRLVEHYYSTLGKRGIEKEREGDQKTPLGVYHVTSSIPGSKLPDLYGWGAFALNYPNEWDRLQGRTGYGIWIHGVPSDTYARAPQASDGCIALANPEIEQLASRVQPGATPVIIAQRVEWVAPDARRAERETFLRELEAWRDDWEGRDGERYLAHYAASFRSDGMDLERWRAHKRRVNATKSWIRVSLANVSVLRDPGRAGLMVVTFDQDYRSSNLLQKSRKRQYWVLQDGRWKIAYEAPVGRPMLALPESYPRGGSKVTRAIATRDAGK